MRNPFKYFHNVAQTAAVATAVLSFSTVAPVAEVTLKASHQWPGGKGDAWFMTAPILLPIILAAGFDPCWFAVVFTIDLEIGLITPPAGLNLYVINGITPDVSLPTILGGALPFMLCMVPGIPLPCLIPEIATWLPDLPMGPALRRWKRRFFRGEPEALPSTRLGHSLSGRRPPAQPAGPPPATCRVYAR